VSEAGVRPSEHDDLVREIGQLLASAQHAAALALAEWALARWPSDARLPVYASVGARLAGRLDLAVAHAHRAAALAPADAIGHAALADALHELGRHVEAAHAAYRAVSAAPDCPEHHLRYTLALAGMPGGTEAARESARRLLALRPDDPECQKLLATLTARVARERIAVGDADETLREVATAIVSEQGVPRALALRSVEVLLLRRLSVPATALIAAALPVQLGLPTRFGATAAACVALVLVVQLVRLAALGPAVRLVSWAVLRGSAALAGCLALMGVGLLALVGASALGRWAGVVAGICGATAGWWLQHASRRHT